MDYGTRYQGNSEIRYGDGIYSSGGLVGTVLEISGDTITYEPANRMGSRATTKRSEIAGGVHYSAEYLRSIGMSASPSGARAMAADKNGATLAVGDRVHAPIAGSSGKIESVDNPHGAVTVRWDSGNVSTYQSGTGLVKMSAVKMAQFRDGDRVRAGNLSSRSGKDGKTGVITDGGSDGSGLVWVKWDDSPNGFGSAEKESELTKMSSLSARCPGCFSARPVVMGVVPREGDRLSYNGSPGVVVSVDKAHSTVDVRLDNGDYHKAIRYEWIDDPARGSKSMSVSPARAVSMGASVPQVIAEIRRRVNGGMEIRAAARAVRREMPALCNQADEEIGSYPSSEPELRALQETAKYSRMGAIAPHVNARTGHKCAGTGHAVKMGYYLGICPACNARKPTDSATGLVAEHEGVGGWRVCPGSGKPSRD